MAKTITLVDVSIQDFGFYLSVPEGSSTPEWWCQCRFNDIGNDNQSYNADTVRFRVPTAYQNNIQTIRDWLYNQIKTRQGI